MTHLRPPLRPLPAPLGPHQQQQLHQQLLQQLQRQQAQRQQLQEDRRQHAQLPPPPPRRQHAQLPPPPPRRQQWQEELETIFGDLATRTGPLRDALFRLARQPQVVRRLLLLLAAFEPADRYYLQYQQHVRLATLVRIYNSHNRRQTLTQFELLRHFDTQQWVIVRGGHPQEHTPNDGTHFNAYSVGRRAFVALWRVAAHPELVDALERRVARRHLQPVETLRFPGSTDFDNARNCIFKLGLGLLVEAHGHFCLPGGVDPDADPPEGTVWMAYGASTVEDNRLVVVSSNDPAEGYGEYSDHISVDFVLPMEPAYLT